VNEFFKMLGDPAHWAFEIFVTLILDGLLLGIFWPLVRNCWRTWKVSRELAVRAEFTAHLMDTAPLCSSCGTLPMRMDTSVDLCFGCGDVSVPKRKPIRWTKEYFEADKKARLNRQRKCDHHHNGINIMARDGVCSLCLMTPEKAGDKVV